MSNLSTGPAGQHPDRPDTWSDGSFRPSEAALQAWEALRCWGDLDRDTAERLLQLWAERHTLSDVDRDVVLAHVQYAADNRPADPADGGWISGTMGATP